jgi:hypothetical protein
MMSRMPRSLRLVTGMQVLLTDLKAAGSKERAEVDLAGKQHS